MKKRSLLLVSSVVTVIATLFLTLGYVRGESSTDSFKFQYAAKFVCGKNPAKRVRVLPGQYATAVNIHNPNSRAVRIRTKLALTFPSARQAPGLVSEFFEGILEPHLALEVDCGEIPRKFFPGMFPLPPYTKGFVIIQSDRSLDVTAVYTAGAVIVRSIDVEQIRERRISARDDDDDDDDDDYDDSDDDE